MPATRRDRTARLLFGGALLYALYELYQQGRTLRQISAQLETMDEDNLYHSIEGTRHVQSLLWLHDRFQFDVPLPLMRGWAISPDFAVYLVTLLEQKRPTQVVELGGGTSTILSGHTLTRLADGGRVTAIDAHAEFADITRGHLARQGVGDVAQVRHAPLVAVEASGEAWAWYDTATFDDLDDIDFLLVDGPSQFRNPKRMARYPALPLLFDRLASGAYILLDDTHRDDETWIIERWLREFPNVKLVERRDEFEKGAVLLQKQG
jgi:predicted O-methyltransferase YrrM